MSEPAYRDASRPVEERVDDLLGRMTLEEKVAQLTGILPFELLGPAGLDEQKFADHLRRRDRRDLRGRVALTRSGPAGPDVGSAPALPRRTHAPRHPGDRAPRGVGRARAPGLRRLPDRDHHGGVVGSRVGRSGDARRGAAVRCAPWASTRRCSPNLDLARDARWGRVQETYGEDPYLGSAIGVAFIRGLQGDDRREGVLATAKHFLGYAMAYGGRNIGAVQLGERELLEVYARPFGAAIAEAGLESVMCAYSDLNGEPAAASRRLLTDMLRGTLGFRGLTVADYGAVNALATRQRTADRPGRCRRAGARGRARRRAPGLALLHGRPRARRSATVCSTKRWSTGASAACSTRSSGSGSSRTRTATSTRSPRPTPTTRVARRVHWPVASPLDRRSCSRTRRACCRSRRDLSRVAVIGPNAKSIRNLFGGYSAPQAIEMMTSGDMGLPPVLGGETDVEPEPVPERGRRRGRALRRVIGRHRRRLRLRAAHRHAPVGGRARRHRSGVPGRPDRARRHRGGRQRQHGGRLRAGLPRQRPLHRGDRRGSRRGRRLRRRDPGARRQDRPGERRGRRRDPRPHDPRARRCAATPAGGRVRDRRAGRRRPARLPAPAGAGRGRRARRGGPRVPTGIGGRRRHRRRPLRHREPVRAGADHHPAHGRSVPDLPRVQERQRPEHVHRPRRQRSCVRVRSRA